MSVRVLVVDDSRFFRKRIEAILKVDETIEIVGFAVNGKEAVEMAAELKPDVITMDVEMPVMDGITAVRHIMRCRPVPILMFSSLTTNGAQSTLDALDAGALDFIPKRFEDISSNSDDAQRLLRRRVKEIARKGHAINMRVRHVTTPPDTHRSFSATARSALTPPRSKSTPQMPIRSSGIASPQPKVTTAPVSFRVGVKKLAGIKLLAIGTSTGGPVALQNLLTALPADFPLPIVMVQHMPGTFTPAFAERLNQVCAISVKEAQSGDLLRPGVALLAPGGMQMTIARRGSQYIVKVDSGDPQLNYKPSVDVTFSSIAANFKGRTLGVILTGMGADGREGCRALKQKEAAIWAQDEQSSVVYGMPFAVFEAGLTDKVFPLTEMGPAILQGV